mgnify:CR=1 FL=1
MASYYRRRNGTYCVRVSNGCKDGKQELLSATYKPPKRHAAELIAAIVTNNEREAIH